jgi:glycosyltransferase involved in cell wall biosynthesis
MHILFLTQILPYPPTSGPKVKTWHVLRYLSQQGHKITLVSFVRAEELPYIETVKQVCATVHVVPLRRSRLKDIGFFLFSLLSRRPFLVERDDLLEMRSIVNQVVNTEQVDVIHADQLTMTQFGFPLKLANEEDKKPALVFDAHNAVWTIMERMKENAPFFLRPPLWWETRQIKQYEGMIVSRFHATLAVTEPDRVALLDAVHAYDGNHHEDIQSISVIPIAVDTRQIQPVARERDSLNILTMGTLYYPPNADGIRWFVQDVFPLIRRTMPNVTLTIVGKNPPKDFLRLAEEPQNGVIVTGFVEDLDPYFARSALMVIPVRAGGGMRVRILEAFARAMPVVTTTVGLEGIQAQPGQDVLVADTPADFAQSVIKLLQDKMLQDKLSANGRRLVENKYDWQVVLADLGNTYERLARDTK